LGVLWFQHHVVNHIFLHYFQIDVAHCIFVDYVIFSFIISHDFGIKHAKQYLKKFVFSSDFANSCLSIFFMQQMSYF